MSKFLIATAIFICSTFSAFAEELSVMKKADGSYFIQDTEKNVNTGIKVQSGLYLTSEQLKHFVEGDKTSIPFEPKVTDRKWLGLTSFAVTQSWVQELVVQDGVIKLVLHKDIRTSTHQSLVFVLCVACLILMFIGLSTKKNINNPGFKLLVVVCIGFTLASITFFWFKAGISQNFWQDWGIFFSFAIIFAYIIFDYKTPFGKKFQLAFFLLFPVSCFLITLLFV